MTLQRADDDIDAEAPPPADPLPVQGADEPLARGRRRLTRRARWLLIGALALLLAGGAVGVWALYFRTPAAQTTLRTVTVAQETLKQSVNATGTLDPATESDLSFASSGTVTAVDVEPGDLVTKGDKLAAIDDSELQIDYKSAKASRTEAEEALSSLQAEDDATATAIAAAQATVEVKKNAVTQARTALDAATMVSPINGKVAAVTVAEGDTVSGGSSSATSATASDSSGSGAGTAASTSSGSTAAVTLISNGTFTVTTAVSNADVTSIKKGLQATITPTGSAEAVYGTVSTVGVVASTPSTSTSSSSGSATFPVTIKVTGTHKDLLPGSSATVAITVKQLTDVISVPTQAVTTVDGKTVVQKLVNGEQVPTEVTLGASVGASTVITKGLEVGDQVVLGSFRAASTGGTGAGTGTRGGTEGTQNGGAGGFPAGGVPGQAGQAPGQGNPAGTR